MELPVGAKRKFSFKEKSYIIKEIIDDQNIIMPWIWRTGICPHCKKKIDATINHKFYRIEILVEDGLENITKNDILIMGHTLDKRYMHIPIDNQIYNIVLDKSINFKQFKEVK